MSVSIKSKLTAGVLFLFGTMLGIGLLGAILINLMAARTDDILKDNYVSLQYCNRMLQLLEDIDRDTGALRTFEQQLIAQENNITEAGEQVATDKLRSAFENIKRNPSMPLHVVESRQAIYIIIDLNQQAIERKNDRAQRLAKQATTWIAIAGTVIFLLALSFVVNFPSYITNPIRLLREAIVQIGNKKYSTRIHDQLPGEFGELAQAFNLMASRLDEYEHSNLAQLMFEKKRAETMIGQMKDGVIGLDANRKILFMNSLAETTLGLKSSEVVGLYAPDVAVRNDLLRDLLRPEEKDKVLKIVLGNRENFFVAEHREVMNEDQMIGEVIVLKNVTEFKELDLSKTNFIATISHELRTPISSIKIGLELLEKSEVGTLSPEQHTLVEGMKDDANRLLKITGEILNMTQVETGKIQLSLQAASPQEIIHYATEAVKVQAEQKNISIEIDCPENIASVNADREKTEWVLTNLLSNAVRYSYENSNVLLSVRETESKVQFLVQDFGKGIDSKYQHKIFDRYFQIPGSSKSGTGLGLAISKEFIEAQGGEISLQSEIGKGSVFSVTLNKAGA
jgi:signal transduction histidine kinase